jgi:hypothetical protein
LGDKITYWTEINFEPVQTISEFRNGENLLPFNFTVDSNLDPFLLLMLRLIMDMDLYIEIVRMR